MHTEPKRQGVIEVHKTHAKRTKGKNRIIKAQEQPNPFPKSNNKI